jgi:AcrR family transcriptional regulator
MLASIGHLTALGIEAARGGVLYVILHTAMAEMTKRQQQGAESREAILDAAERLMAERGVAGTSMSALTEACGLPASSIYWHFGSKDGVVLAVMERGAERFFESLSPPESFSGTGIERVTAQMDDTARALEEHGDFLRMLLTLVLGRDDLSGPAAGVIDAVRDQARARIETMLVAAVDGSGASADARARSLTSFVLATIDGAFIARHENPEVDLHVVLGQLGAALDGLL